MFFAKTDASRTRSKFRLKAAAGLAVIAGLLTSQLTLIEPAEATMVCPVGWRPTTVAMEGLNYCDLAASEVDKTFVVPAGITSLSAVVVGGGGGGGGGGNELGTNMQSGGGGGGGAVVQGTISVTPGQTITLHGGSGGAAGVGGVSATDGAAGTASWITVDGGSQLLVANPGEGGKSGLNGGHGGASGDGSPGGAGVNTGTGFSSGGGGGGGGNTPASVGLDGTLEKAGNGGEHYNLVGQNGFPTLGVGWSMQIDGFGTTRIAGGGGGGMYSSAAGCTDREGLTAPYQGATMYFGIGHGACYATNGSGPYPQAGAFLGSGGSNRGVGGAAGVGPLGGSDGMPGVVWIRIPKRDLPAHLVTYNYNGGYATPASQYFVIGESALTLPVPVKSGYTFQGWFTESGFTNEVTSPYTPSGDQTLYAKWAAGTYTVTYEYNGATGGNSAVSDSYTTGGTAITLPTPTKTGYSFGGWFEYSSLVVQAFSPYTTTTNRTLYAKWNAPTYRIDYVYNGATSGNSPAFSNYVFGSAGITLPTPAKTGYSFGGWYSDAGLTTQVSSPFTTGAAVTLYAKWIPPLTITFEYNGATAGNTVPNETYLYGDAGITLPEPTKDNFVFGGWYSDSGFTNQVTSPYVTDSDVTLYAKWVSLASKVTFNYNGATGGNVNSYKIYSEGDSNFKLPSPSKTGYTFVGWFYDAALTQAVPLPFTTTTPVSLYAKWMANTYVVEFEYNLATAGDEVKSLSYTTGNAALTLPTPSRPGYDFVGWFSEYNYINQVSSPYVPTVGGHLFAKWVRNSSALIRANVYFAGDSAVLTAKGKATLLSLVKKAKSKSDVAVTVNGFVKQTAGASTKADYRLSLKRAKVIVAFLKSKGLTAVYSAVAKGIAKEKNAKARRAEVSITW